MQRGLELFRPFGISVRLHPGFVLFLAVLVLLAIGAGGEPADVAQRLVAPAVLVVTVLLHEMGHALVARRVGLEVIDVVLTPLGGMARLQGLMEDPAKEISVAAAGPGTNLVVAALAAGPAVAFAPAHELTLRHLFLLDDASILDSHALTMVLSFNLLLGTLNLIPAFPLDGGRMFRGLLTLRIGLLRGTRVAFRLGLWFALLLFFVPLVADVPVSWWVLPMVGVFLLAAGLRERLVVEAREGLGLMQGRMFTATFGRGTGEVPFARPEGAEAGDVIDVSGEAHVIDDDDDERKLPS